MEARVQLVKRELDVIFDSLQSSEPTPARLGLFMHAPSRPLPYSSSRNRDVYDAMKLTDSDPVDGDKVVLLYSSISIESGDRNKEYLCGWNREHVWPQSRAGMSTYAPGIATDLHNIFPVDSSINSTRSNRSFGILDMDPEAVEVVDKSPIEGDGTLAGVLYTKDYWQPPPASRGVIARALMYMACTYHESGLKIVQGCGIRTWI